MNPINTTITKFKKNMINLQNVQGGMIQTTADSF